MKILTIVLMFLGVTIFAEARPLRVVTTTTDLASIASEIGGDKINVSSLSRGTQDHHYVEPRPSMVVTLRGADLVIMVGMDHDIWVHALINSARNQNIRFGRPGYLDASAGIDKIEIPTGRIDASMGHLHIYGNPHYWLDPLNAKIIARNIARRLGQIMPGHREFFDRNLEEFNRRIAEKMVEWEKALEPFEGTKIAVYHRSWPYFTERFGIEIGAELEPKPGISPSPAHLNEVIGTLNRDGIGVIVIEVFHSERPARFVAGQTGAEVVILPSSVGGVEGTDDYFSLMDTIVGKLAEALAK